MTLVIMSLGHYVAVAAHALNAVQGLGLLGSLLSRGWATMVEYSS